jgi:hypothetical protein
MNPIDKLIEADRVRERTDADLAAVEHPGFFTRLQERNNEHHDPVE